MLRQMCAGVKMRKKSTPTMDNVTGAAAFDVMLKSDHGAMSCADITFASPANLASLRDCRTPAGVWKRL
jgi:hypothetical protein